ncbi:MAG: lysostaphin resistance A-like protein [Thermoanaerobaculia bacterium]
MELAVALSISTLLTLILVFANERGGLLAADAFPNGRVKGLAYAWVWLLVTVLTVLVVQSSAASGDIDLTRLSFWSLFVLHVLLLVFLAGWWLMTGRPRIDRFLNLFPADPGRSALIGIAVGVGGWLLTIATMIGIGLLAQAAGLLEGLEPSPVIPWMAGLPLWKRALIVLSAMTVEEAFFRGWLQKRVGLVVSTILFAISHAGYGQPFMLIGVTIISLVIGWTFYRTKNLWPCIIAHGVFDAIQLFVIVPVAVQMGGMS